MGEEKRINGISCPIHSKTIMELKSKDEKTKTYFCCECGIDYILRKKPKC